MLFSRVVYLCQVGSQQEVDGTFIYNDGRGFSERTTYRGVGKDRAPYGEIPSTWQQWGAVPALGLGDQGVI